MRSNPDTNPDSLPTIQTEDRQLVTPFPIPEGNRRSVKATRPSKRISSSGKVEQERLDFKDTLLTPDNPDIVGTHNPDNQDIPSKEKVDKKGKGGDQPRA